MTFAQAVRVDTVRRTCTACPTQYEGQMADGRFFYFRYRHALAELGIGATLDDAVIETLGREIPAISYGDHPMDRQISEAEFHELFVQLLALREEPCG